MFKYYGSSYIFTALAVGFGYWLGGWSVALTVMILAVLETSLSFDNAVVNASVLSTWDEKWRKRFLVWGIPIAVFGMRLVFPLLIVAISASLGPIEALQLAMNDPKQYEQIITSVHREVAAFGGTFLLMVGLNYLLDSEKDEHWIDWIEKPLAYLGKFNLPPVIAIATIILSSYYVPADEQMIYIIAGAWGLVAYMLAQAVGSAVGGEEGGDAAASNVIKAGIGGFLYLELLDASFSFDGVIAAFALTNNIFVMMAGLAVGAMFVRSMTLHLVDKGTLSTYRFLEPAAFYAIVFLAAVMFSGAVGYHLPETVVGLTGGIMIVAGLIHSIVANKRDAVEDQMNQAAKQMAVPTAEAPAQNA